MDERTRQHPSSPRNHFMHAIAKPERRFSPGPADSETHPDHVRFASGVRVVTQQPSLSSEFLAVDTSQSAPLHIHDAVGRHITTRSHTISVRRFGYLQKLSPLGLLILAISLAWFLSPFASSYFTLPSISLGSFRPSSEGSVWTRLAFPSSEPQVSPHVAKLIEDLITQSTELLRNSLLRGPVPYRDFALAEDGGEVVSLLTTTTRGVLHHSNDPQRVLTEDSRIGSCWRVPTPSGQIGISIPELIYPTYFTIDHIPKELAADIGQAPRNMTLWGAVDGGRNRRRYHERLNEPWPVVVPSNDSTLQLTGGHRFLPLANVVYDIHAPVPIQTFPIHPAVVATGIDFGVFVLQVRSNWGSETTCLYRVRIHGDLAIYQQ